MLELGLRLFLYVLLNDNFGQVLLFEIRTYQNDKSSLHNIEKSRQHQPLLLIKLARNFIQNKSVRNQNCRSHQKNIALKSIVIHRVQNKHQRVKAHFNLSIVSRLKSVKKDEKGQPVR